MTLFNHVIEYLPLNVSVGATLLGSDVDIRTAKVEYDNILGDRCEYWFNAPANAWTELTVGGTMSTGGLMAPGIIHSVSGPKYKVSTLGGDYHCYTLPLSQKLQAGTIVMVFDHMSHGPRAYGEFNPALVVDPSQDLLDSLKLHSINMIVWNEGVQIGTIHIDPFINEPNYDDFSMILDDGIIWQEQEFAYHG